ncbi:hypothetical protein CIW54_27090 [Paraburkholderia sp. T12-10]|nr:hypothetical protein CIW54_27090 [Paraburkholderia sp. T12-10]
MSEKNSPAHKSQPSDNEPRHFIGTDNPRHLRVLHVALRHPMPREEVDRVAGASNGPDLISDLRAKGLDFHCHRVRCLDRDGVEVKRGIYALTERDRRQIARWLARRDGGQA